MKIEPVAYLRTILPALIGSLLTWAGVHIPAVTGWLDSTTPDWRLFVYAVLTAAVIAVYYWAARQLGKRWPAVEAIMLGSSKLPTYIDAGTAGATPARITSVDGPEHSL